MPSAIPGSHERWVGLDPEQKMNRKVRSVEVGRSEDVNSGA